MCSLLAREAVPGPASDIACRTVPQTLVVRSTTYVHDARTRWQSRLEAQSEAEAACRQGGNVGAARLLGEGPVANSALQSPLRASARPDSAGAPPTSRAEPRFGAGRSGRDDRKFCLGSARLRPSSPWPGADTSQPLCSLDRNKKNLC